MLPAWFPKNHPTPHPRRPNSRRVLPVTATGPAAWLQPRSTPTERSQRSHSSGKARALSEGRNSYLGEGEAGTAELFPQPEKQWPAGLYNVTPAATQPAGTGCRERQGRNTKGGRMGGAGGTRWSWNCSAFRWRYCRKPDLIRSAIHRSASYNDVKSSSPCLSNSH